MSNLLAQLLSALTPYIIQALVALFLAALTWAQIQTGAAQRKIKAKTGLDVEAILRQALHQALTSGVLAAEANGETNPGMITKIAIGHARNSVPDAVARLGATDAIMSTIAKGKIQLGAK